MKKGIYKIITVSVIASFLITGCSVKPEPMLNDDVKKQIENNISLLNEVALPVTEPITINEAINRGLE